MTRQTLSIQILMALLVLSTLLPAVAQPPGVTQAPYQETVEVDLFNVDVYVVDKRGRPVTGLTADEFQLLVDGQPVRLTNFLAVTGGMKQLEGPVGSAEPITASTPEERRSPSSTSSQPKANPHHMVVYMDNVNTRPAGRQRVLKQLRKYLHKHHRSQDQVMFVNYDGGLKIHQPFTDDREVIEQALTDLLTVPALGFRQDRLRQEAIGLARGAGCQQGSVHARNFSAQVYAEVDASILALESLIGSLAGIPDQKTMLYISDGLPTRAGEEVFYMLAGICQTEASQLMASAGEYDHTNTLRKLAAHANSNRVTLFPIEAMGLVNYTSSNIEVGPRAMMATGADESTNADVVPTWADGEAPLNLAGGGVPETILDQILAGNRQGSLFYLADQTGGRAVLNANNLLPELSRIDKLLRNYYSLGFQPVQMRDRRVHSLHVDLDRPGLQALYRRNFVDLPWAQRIADQLQALLAHDGHWDNPLGAQLEIVSVEPAARGLYEATFRIRLQVASLLLAPTADGRQTGNLRVLLSSQDDKGNRSEVRDVSLPIGFSTAQLQDHPDLNTVHDFRITLRSGRQTLGFAILDEPAKIASFLSREIDATGN